LSLIKGVLPITSITERCMEKFLVFQRTTVKTSGRAFKR